MRRRFLAFPLRVTASWRERVSRVAAAKRGLKSTTKAGTRTIAPIMFAPSSSESSRLMSAAKRRLLMKYQKMIPPTRQDPVKKTAIPVVRIV